MFYNQLFGRVCVEGFFGWVPKNWCFWNMVLEKTLENPLNSKEIKSVNPKGNQPWIFIGRTDAETETPVLWPSDVKSQLTGKDLDAGKDWGQEEKGRDGWMASPMDHYSMDMSLAELREMMKDRKAWPAAFHGVAKNRKQLSGWATTDWNDI